MYFLNYGLIVDVFVFGGDDCIGDMILFILNNGEMIFVVLIYGYMEGIF